MTRGRDSEDEISSRFALEPLPEASGQCLTLNVKFMLFNGLKGTIYQGLNDWKCWYYEDSIPWNIRKYIAQPKLERFLLNWIAALKKENPKSILKKLYRYENKFIKSFSYFMGQHFD